MKDNTSKISDTVKAILEAHFHRFTIPNIDALTEAWVEEEGDKGLKDAFFYNHAMINYSHEKAQKLLQDNGFCKEGFEKTNHALLTFSRHATGNLIPTDPILSQCKRLSSLTEKDLQNVIGDYFKSKTNSYLEEKFPDLFEKEKIKSQEYDHPQISFDADSFEGEIANDVPPASFSPTTSYQLSSRKAASLTHE